jgi:hypothetical protein
MDRSELADDLERIDLKPLHEFERETICKAAAALRSTAWRPMSEAPRDGTRILALWGSIVVDGREYKPDITTTKCHDGEWVSLDSNDYMYGEPDAWMPLPPPPSDL